MHERIRDKLLARWGHAVATHPVLTLLACVAVAGVSVYFTATGLEFQSDRSALIDPDRPWNKEYAGYKTNFPRYHDVTIVIDGDPGDRAVDELARKIARRIARDERIETADAGFDAAEAGPKFFMLGSDEQFDRALEELTAAGRVAACENANAALGILLAGLGRQQDDPAALDRLDEFLAPYLAAARGEPASFEFLKPDRSRWQPLAGEDGRGRLRFVHVHLAGAADRRGVNELASILKWLRRRVAEIVAEQDVPDVAWGVTGIPAIESDETTEAIHDSTVASVLAICLITLVMFVAFRGLRVPLLAAGALLIGLAWSFGWLMVSVGHLQLLSVVFSVILLGMGIDFALLFVSRLELVKNEHDSLASATARVYRGIGPGMVTGAVTTAAAFGATALTDFKGMAEMGLIAAGGIVLCLIAVLSAFPALLALTGRWKDIIRARPGGETAHFARGRLDFVDHHPVAMLVVVGAAVAALLLVALRVDYDPNVLNLQAPGVESVIWEKRVAAEDERSAWSAVVLTSPQQAGPFTERLRGVEGVAGVGGMGMLVAAGSPDRLERVEALRVRSFGPFEARPGMPEMLEQLAAVRAGILSRAGSVPPDVAARLAAIAGRIEQSISAARALGTGAAGESWGALNDAFLAARNELTRWLDEALGPGPPTVDDLPPLLRQMWVGADGSWLLRIFPASDPQGRSILDPRRLGPFVESLKTVMAGTGVDVIGPPVQIYESSELIQTEYIKAAVYALAAILVLLILDFRKVSDALCAIVPVLVGFIGAFGMMGLIGVPLNFANIIVLPIIFGIGVNAGVHVVHRWRLEPRGEPQGLSGGTGRGITLTMLTTMIGFGCLLIAQHRGIQSLGFVMVIGLGVTLLACYTALPALLRLRNPAGRAVPAAAAAAETAAEPPPPPPKPQRRHKKKQVA